MCVLVTLENLRDAHFICIVLWTAQGNILIQNSSKARMGTTSGVFWFMLESRCKHMYIRMYIHVCMSPCVYMFTYECVHVYIKLRGSWERPYELHVLSTMFFKSGQYSDIVDRQDLVIYTLPQALSTLKEQLEGQNYLVWCIMHAVPL